MTTQCNAKDLKLQFQVQILSILSTKNQILTVKELCRNQICPGILLYYLSLKPEIS